MLSLVLAGTLFASSPIFKCVSATGQVSYSQRPCAKAEVGKVVKQPGVPAPPAALKTGVQFVDTEAQKRSVPPVVNASCQVELQDTRRATDQSLRDFAKRLSEKLEKRQLNLKQQQEASSSKVGAEWLVELQQQYSGLTAEIADLENLTKQAVESEANKYREMKGRCTG